MAGWLCGHGHYTRVCAGSLFHAVASPFHSLVITCGTVPITPTVYFPAVSEAGLRCTHTQDDRRQVTDDLPNDDRFVPAAHAQVHSAPGQQLAHKLMPCRKHIPVPSSCQRKADTEQEARMTPGIAFILAAHELERELPATQL